MYAEDEKRVKNVTKIIIYVVIGVAVLVGIYFLLPSNTSKTETAKAFEEKILSDAKIFASMKKLDGNVFISLADIEDAIGSSYDTCNKSTGVDYINGKFEPYVICSKYVSSKIEEINSKEYNNITLKEDAFFITSNNKYVEPGYVSKYNVDVNSVSSYPKQGIYQTTYSVKDSSGKVIEVASRYVLYSNFNNELKEAHMFLNGEKEIYIKKGSKFYDPGVTLIDEEGNDLSNDVKVTGSVNTQVPGVYNLTYTLNQFVLTRKVIVTSISYSATLSKTTLTNTAIKIIIDVQSDDFERLVLPNSASVYNSHYEHEVLTNGTYKFGIYTKRSGYIEITKEVTNIDRTKPTVSCTGKSENKVTAVNVTAKDDNGIKYYKYGSFSDNITKSSYAINQTVSTIWVTVTDNAGNMTETQCNITVIQPKKEDPPATTTPPGTTTPETPDPNGNYKVVRLTTFDDAGLARCGSTCVQEKIASGDIKTDERGWYMYKYNGKWYHVVATAINNQSLIEKYGHPSYTDITYYNYFDTFRVYISDTTSSSTMNSNYKAYDVIVLDICGACMKFSTKLQDIHPGWSTATINKWRSDAIKGNSIKIDLWTTSQATNPADWAFIDG